MSNAAEWTTLRRLFRCHVLAVVLTAVAIGLVLMTITIVPNWVAIFVCAVVVCSLIAFPVVTANTIRQCPELPRKERLAVLATDSGLSLLQGAFVLPVLLCVYAPNVNLTTILFGRLWIGY